MKNLIFILALISCLTSTALSCSMSKGLEMPMSEANVKAYIFIGEVVGYTDVIKARVKPNSFETSDKFFGEGWGLKIKPVEAINLPKIPAEYFELYKFDVTAWCADKLRDASYIKIGTKIRVVANEAALLPDKNNDNHIKLESKVFDHFSIVMDDEFESSESLEFDYKSNWKFLRDKFLAAKDYEKIQAFDDFIYLETTKDLIRLKNSTSKEKRYEILERLIYNPKVDYPALISPVLMRYNFSLKHSVDPGKERKIKLSATEEELLKKRKELEISGYFKFSELIDSVSRMPLF